MAIYQGSTPTHYFELPFSGSRVKGIEITYAQNGNVLFVKNTEDCTITETEAITELTQEETFLLYENSPVKIQIRILDDNDKVHPSEEISDLVKKTYSKEVLE